MESQTNPSLLSKESGNPKDAMEEITKIIKGDVSLEVVSTNYSGMMEEGKRLVNMGIMCSQSSYDT